MESEVNLYRPLPEAADAVAEAAAVVQADAELVGRMLAEIRSGWLWAFLTAQKPSNRA
jgi:hypothetical protein